MKAARLETAFALLFVAAMAGCSPPKQDLATAHFQPIPTGYEQQIKTYFDGVLRDPYTSHYEFGLPYKAAGYLGLVRGGGWAYGYAVDVKVNAKNAFGGYTGKQVYRFLFSEGLMYDLEPIAVQQVNPIE